MEVINIREKLEALNKELENTKRKEKQNVYIEEFIPEHKVEDLKILLKSNVIDFLEGKVAEIEKKQTNFNENELSERQIYAEKQIKKLQKKINEFDSQRIFEIQNLISTLDHLKGYNKKPLPILTVEEKQTVQIFKFLSEINYNEKFVYLKNYLQRKIHFNFQKPTEKEIRSLKKLKQIVKKENKFI